jgi:prepilin-type N-terminal cleavage/methylation domain-containing protein
MTSRWKARSPRGLSLVEAMVTVAIVCILAILGVPALKGLLHARAQATQIDSFTAALRFALAEAMWRGEQVSVCARDGAGAADAARSQSARTDRGVQISLISRLNSSTSSKLR